MHKVNISSCVCTICMLVRERNFIYHYWSEKTSLVHPWICSCQGDTEEIAWKNKHKLIKKYLLPDWIYMMKCDKQEYQAYILVKSLLNFPLTCIFINPKNLKNWRAYTISSPPSQKKTNKYIKKKKILFLSPSWFVITNQW